MAEIDAYNEALSSGQYQKPGGLLGKYDNVRRFWEDEQLGLYLGPYLEQLIDRRKESARRLRVLDLGCGSGDGFEFLTSIKDSRSLISEHKTMLVSPEVLELYRGIDVNEGLLAQGRAIYGDKHNLDFVLSDINDYNLASEEPYDLYLANYGTLSHNNDEQTIALLSKIANHSQNGGIIVVDWLGRFSYEWWSLWTRDFKNNQWMDYIISYLSSDSQIATQDLTSFPLRIMGRDEVRQIYLQAKKRAGGSLTLRRVADRSSLVGRHIDTGQYNPHSQPLRRLLNSLFEPNVSTNLEELIIHYVPKDGFNEINVYYQELTDWWNYLIILTKSLLEHSTPPQVPARIPAAVRRAISTMKGVVRVSVGMKLGNPRASLVEPQLGYCLREIEMGLQKGLGCGHGLVAIFKVVK